MFEKQELRLLVTKGKIDLALKANKDLYISFTSKGMTQSHSYTMDSITGGRA